MQKILSYNAILKNFHEERLTQNLNKNAKHDQKIKNRNKTLHFRKFDWYKVSKLSINELLKTTLKNVGVIAFSLI